MSTRDTKGQRVLASVHDDPDTHTVADQETSSRQGGCELEDDLAHARGWDLDAPSHTGTLPGPYRPDRAGLGDREKR